MITSTIQPLSAGGLQSPLIAVVSPDFLVPTMPNFTLNGADSKPGAVIVFTGIDCPLRLRCPSHNPFRLFGLGEISRFNSERIVLSPT
jgi:hypothetical protein